MQQNILDAINEFFNENLSRKASMEETLKLHDEYTRDYEGMVTHANSRGITYNQLLKLALADQYADEIKAETDAYRLYLEFNNSATMALESLVRFKEAAKAILESPQTKELVDQIGGNPDAKVTVLEPMMLKVFLDDALKSCYDATLKEMVLRKDPDFSQVGSDGKPWYSTILEEDRVTVNSIKRVREVFRPGLVSITDGKRIVELVHKGIIRSPK